MKNKSLERQQKEIIERLSVFADTAQDVATSLTADVDILRETLKEKTKIIDTIKLQLISDINRDEFILELHRLLKVGE